MCPKQEEKEGLDRLHLHKPGTFGRRDHSDLWETLADRGVLQDLQKSYLQLVTECHSLSYDALIAHVAIVFTRYLMIAMEQRRCEDNRTLGEIFFFFTDELADTTFGESFQIIITAMIDSVCAIF